MKKVGIFMADGCEEIEGLTVVDIVRRAKLEMTTISITDKKEVTSSHNVTFLTDALASEVDFDGFDAIVLPGGMPGTLNLGASDMVNKVIKKFAGEGKIGCSNLCSTECFRGSRIVGRKTCDLPSGI